MELLPEVSLPTPTRLRVSPSKISCFQDCPKKYDYVYKQSLQPKPVQRTAFDKGNYCHELMHVYYQLIQSGVTPGSEFALQAIISRIQNDLQNAKNISLMPVYASITKTMVRFISEQSPIIDRGITVLGIEHELAVPITTPAGRNLQLFGFIDLVYRDAQGRLRIRDHKTGQKAWTKAEANNSNQLMFYSASVWKMRRELPMAEISFLNVKDYVKKAPSFEDAFAFPTVTYTEKELVTYLRQTLQLIDQMLVSEPIPHYGRQCNWCPFRDPCAFDRKGIDSSMMLASQFTVVDRNQVRKHGSFTDDNSAEDVAD
jgi:hypothetical protein